jgi:NAD+ diphosphatase
MRIAESVTFGGSGLDRGAARRGDSAALAQALADLRARVWPIWRGRPLIADASDASGQGAGPGAAGGWVAPGHPVLVPAGGALVYLGEDAGAPRFAADISGWEPPPDAPRPDGSFFDTSRQAHPDLPDGPAFADLRGVMTLLSPREAEFAATAKAILGWHQSHRFCSACGAASAMAEGGWQRRCPSCGATHFPRTDPVVIMLVLRGNAVLLGRSAGWPEGMYSLLAGFMEPGETVEAAVRREVAEETGVTVGRVRYLASQPWPYPSSIMLGCAAEATSEAITPDPAEIEAALWVTREELAEVFAGTHPVIRTPRSGAIAGFLLANWLADRLD